MKENDIFIRILIYAGIFACICFPVIRTNGLN